MLERLVSYGPAKYHPKGSMVEVVYASEQRLAVGHTMRWSAIMLLWYYVILYGTYDTLSLCERLCRVGTQDLVCECHDSNAVLSFQIIFVGSTIRWEVAGGFPVMEPYCILRTAKYIFE